PQTNDVRNPFLKISGLSHATAGIIAYSPAGGGPAVASDNTIRIYDPRMTASLSLNVARTLTGHSAQILGLGFRDTNTLVSISMDQTAKIWDVDTGKLLHTAGMHLGKPGRFVIAPGHSSFAADISAGHARLWNYQTGELLKDFQPNDSWASVLAF